jgi:undecaprenyl-diphosphatase
VGTTVAVPVLIAVAVAAVVGATLIGVLSVTRRGHHDPDDAGNVRIDAAKLGQSIAHHSRLRRFLLDRRDPQKETGLLLTIAVLVIGALIVAIGALLLMVRRNSGFARWDASAARFGAEHATSAVTDAMAHVTDLGASVVAIGLAIVVGGLYFIRTRRPAVPAYLLTTVLSTVAVNNLVKWIVDRPRPDFARLYEPHGSSFPSGHTATAAATYAALALVLGRGRSRSTKGALVAAAAGITVAVATSRVLLGVHWLTDVAAGAAMGWACFVVASIAFGGRALQVGRSVATAQEAAEDATKAHARTSSPDDRATAVSR